ncbi:hypothetical protein AtEden1_Chr2g0237601 [Arabidopsis thaliana]
MRLLIYIICQLSIFSDEVHAPLLELSDQKITSTFTKSTKKIQSVQKFWKQFERFEMLEQGDSVPISEQNLI